MGSVPARITGRYRVRGAMNPKSIPLRRFQDCPIAMKAGGLQHSLPMAIQQAMRDGTMIRRGIVTRDVDAILPGQHSARSAITRSPWKSSQGRW